MKKKIKGFVPLPPREKSTDVENGRWYGLVDGYVHSSCCRCGLTHRIEVALIQGNKFVEKRPKGKVAISWWYPKVAPKKSKRKTSKVKKSNPK